MNSALRRLELPLVVAFALLAALWASRIQTFEIYRYWDSDEYFVMTQQLAAGETNTAAAPYAYRILTPAIVAACCPADIQRGFLAVNLAAGIAAAVLLVMWLRRFVASAGVRLLMAAAFAWHWIEPLRFVFYYPAYVDPLFQALVLAALIAGDRWLERRSTAAGVTYVILVAVGALARETMLVVPACALVAAIARRQRDGWTIGWAAAALGAGVLAIAATRLGTDARAGYGFLDAMVRHLRTKRIESLVLMWFLTFGPMLAIVVYDWRATRAFLRQRPDLAAFLALGAVLAYLGGRDTERILSWTFPVVYLLIAQSIARHRSLLSPVLVAVIVLAQAVSQRVFWAIPDPGNAVAALSEMPSGLARFYAVLNRVVVIDDFHWNLWSDFGSRPFHLVQLAGYVAVSALIIMMMARRARRAAGGEQAVIA